MERKIPRDRSISLGKRVVMSTVLAASLSAGINEFNTSGHEPTPERRYPEDIFIPVIIPQSSIHEKSHSPYSNLIVEFLKIPNPNFLEQSLSNEEERELKIKKELEEVVSIMKDHPNTFSEKYIKDVQIYFPIYKAVAEKYNIDWYILFIIHEKETGASKGEKGFLPNAGYDGAMQLDRSTWTKDYTTKASKGLDYLKDLPQRHQDDWSNIATAGRIFSANQHLYEENEDSRSTAILKALLRYSSEGPARERFEMYKMYNWYLEETR